MVYPKMIGDGPTWFFYVRLDRTTYFFQKCKDVACSKSVLLISTDVKTLIP